MKTIKLKNIECLETYPEIEKIIEQIALNKNKKTTKERFSLLVKALEKLIIELMIFNSLYYENDKCSFEDIVKILLDNKVLTDEQATLFNSIKQAYPGLKAATNENQSFETLKNFCVRLDNEIPSIVSHLGVEIVETTVENEDYLINENANNSNVQQQKTEAKTKSHKEVKVKLSTTQKIRNKIRSAKETLKKIIKTVVHSKIYFAAKTIIVLIVAILLINITFVNKMSSQELRSVYDDLSEGDDEIAAMSNFSFPGNLLNSTGEMIDFLKFE